MRAWVLVPLGLGAGVALFLVAVAAAPGLLREGPSSLGGGAMAASCGYTVYRARGEEMPPADLDRTYAHARGDVFALPFPAGPFYATIEYVDPIPLFLDGRPPLVGDPDACPDEPFSMRLRATGEGETRFRVWLAPAETSP